MAIDDRDVKELNEQLEMVQLVAKAQMQAMRERGFLGEVAKTFAAFVFELCGNGFSRSEAILIATSFNLGHDKK